MLIYLIFGIEICLCVKQREKSGTNCQELVQFDPGIKTFQLLTGSFAWKSLIFGHHPLIMQRTAEKLLRHFILRRAHRLTYRSDHHITLCINKVR